MFGYVTVNKAELKVKEYEKYQAYYCGLCSSLRDYYGLLGEVTLTYDMTFLSILLSALYEEEENPTDKRCVVHPMKKHQAISNRFSEYAADMNMLLSYYKLLDDYEDDKSVKALTLAAAIRKRCQKASKKNRRQAKAIKEYIVENKACEEVLETDYDKVAGATGRMLGELFAYREDEWAPYLRKMGFYLGKFIYLMDAYDDLEEDVKSGNYNPLKQIYDDPDRDKKVAEMLGIMASEATKEFEKLPIFQNVELLRNILYSGIWNRFSAMRNNEPKENKDGGRCERSI